ncbi:MAG: ABC transporter substrate-binding protein, partial [Firmicutes bacterium]|nr:ABC transporter substrate-binding protein [Bacillota bacterium]
MREGKRKLTFYKKKVNILSINIMKGDRFMRKKGVLGMKLKRITPVLVVVLLTVFALAGCGAPPVPSGKENAEVKESNTSGDSIPIGILVPYTGEMGAFGVSVFNGAKTAVEEINKAGGPLGKPIKLY